MSLRIIKGLSGPSGSSLNFSLTKTQDKEYSNSNPPKKSLSNVPNLDTEVNPFNKSKGKNLQNSETDKSLNLYQTMNFKVNISEFSGELVNPYGQGNTLPTFIEAMKYDVWHSKVPLFDTTPYISQLVQQERFGFEYPLRHLIKFGLKLNTKKKYDLLFLCNLSKFFYG